MVLSVLLILFNEIWIFIQLLQFIQFPLKSLYVYTDVDLFRHLINFDKQRD